MGKRFFNHKALKFFCEIYGGVIFTKSVSAYLREREEKEGGLDIIILCKINSLIN